GHGPKSTGPSINSSLIYYSIFSEESFLSVFDMMPENKENFIKVINTQNLAFSPSKLLKIPLTIKDTSVPVSIGADSIVFFWGRNSLPNYTPECANYSTSNNHKEVLICHVNGMDRCAANISDLPHFIPFSFLSTDGSLVSQFAWLCPEGTFCCGWECCDVEKESRFGDIFAAVFVSICSVILLILGLTKLWQRYHRLRSHD
ncbi:hypothetical protein PENTCL1PPCAC_1940, partial [Pristionchus entomophagus]